MKKYLYILYGWILTMNYCYGQYPICASGNISTCTNFPVYVVAGNQTKYDFSNWDWTNQDPCNWIAFPSGTQSTGGGLNYMCVKPPFANSTGRVGSMDVIAESYDYLNANPLHKNEGIYGDPTNNPAIASMEKDKGWELLNADFNTYHPYFILYNKYSAKVRAFFYIPDNLITQNYTYYAIICTYGQNQGPGILAGANDPIKALDQYDDQIASNDMIVKSITTSSVNSWVSADFSMMYDPNIGSFTNDLNKMSIQFFGVTEYNIVLSGTLESPYASNGTEHAMVGKSSGISGSVLDAQSANAKLKKLFTNTLGIVSSIQAIEKLIPDDGEISKRELKKKLNAALGKGPGATQTPAQGTLNFVTLIKTASQVSDIVSAAVGIFQLFAGNVSGASSTPDVASAYDVSLTGTMNLAANLSGANIKIPGTALSVIDNNTSYLYDCPMGRIHLEKTPTLRRGNYYARASNPPSNNWEWRYKAFGYEGEFIKCFFDENIKATENIVKDRQGNNLVRTDIKYAFKMKPTANSGDGQWYDIFNPYIKGDRYRKQNVGVPFPSYTYETFNVRNQVKEYLDKGIFILHKYETNGRHTYGTPYLSAEQIKGIIFEIPSATEVRLAVMATYKNMATGEVYVFSNSFAVDFAPDSNPYITLRHDEEYWLYPLTNFYNSLPMRYSFNSPFYQGHLLNSVYSATEVEMLPGFNSTVGYGAVGIAPYIYNGGTFVMNTDYVSGTCGNSQGQRVAAWDEADEADTKGYSFYPNPSDGHVRLQLPKEVKQADLHVYNDKGTEVYTEQIDGAEHAELNLSDQAAGIYLVKINTGNETITEKIVVVK